LQERDLGAFVRVNHDRDRLYRERIAVGGSTMEGIVRLGRHLLKFSLALSCTGAIFGADEPQPAPAADSPERPRIRYWLDETPAAEPARKEKVADAEPREDAAPLPIEPVPVQEEIVHEQPVRQNVGNEPLIVPPNSVNARAANAHNPAVISQVRAKMKEAKREYDCKHYERTVAITRSILEVDPRNIEAAELLRQAQGKITDADEKVAGIAGERRDREAILETDEHAVRPAPRLPTVRPRLPRRGDGEETARRAKMLEKLSERVSIDFIEADLEYVLNTLFKLTGVNIMADPAAMQGKTLTLHVDDLPLKEVLNFIVRNNEGIQYSVTEDAVWITASDSSDLKKIMFPRIYPLHHGLVSTIAGVGVATGERSGGTGRAGTGRGGATGSGGGQPRGAGGAQQQEESYIETVLKWVKDAKDPQMFPDGSDYLVDRQSNQLIVFTTPAGHQKIAEFLDYFDAPPLQVLIKARFLDVSQANEKSIGFNLDRLNTRANFNPDVPPGATQPGDVEGTLRDPFRLFNLTGGTPGINIPGTLGPGTVFTLTGRRTDPQFQVTVNALLNSRNTKILSEPQILAINNKEAIIDITTHFSYITDLRPVTTTSTAGNGTAISNVSAFVPEFDEENIGFTLVVTPSVGRDLKTINLHLNPVIDTLAQGQQITQFQQFDISQVNQNTGQTPTIQRPTIDQTSLETDVVLEDNGYVIIGGLLRNRAEIRERKVPGLHRIPYLGNLFKSKSTDLLKSNLMIIVEAQIITPGGRTYYRDTELDDIDIREGGVPKAPGQVSDAGSGKGIEYGSGRAMPENVRSALNDYNPKPDLADDRSIHAPARKRRNTPVALPPEPEAAMKEIRNEEALERKAPAPSKVAPQPDRKGDPSLPSASRNADDALAATSPTIPASRLLLKESNEAEEAEERAPVRKPAPKTENGGETPPRRINKTEVPAAASKESAMLKGLSPREQMERLAKASQKGDIPAEMKHAPRNNHDSGWAVAEEEVSDKSDSAAPKAEEVQP